MSNNSALRIRHDHEIDLSDKMPDLAQGFTIEAWVRPAPMDHSVRLYPQPGYGGAPVRLKEGLYRNIAADHLPQFGSACLPEEMEAVFFSEPDFQGDSLAIRQDLPQAPASQQKIGSVVVLDRSHRRQNHVVLFAQAGYQGKAEVLILPDFWQRPDAHDAEQPAADQKPGLTQVGSAWVPPGVALEVTQLHTTHVADAGSMTFELWSCDSQFRTVYDVQFVTPSVEARPVLNSTNDLPKEWGVNLQAGQPAALPKNRVVFLFEKVGFAGRQTIIAGQDAGQLSHLATVGSAIYVAVEGTAGVIGIGPKSQYTGEPQIRFFAVGDPLPADAINWRFWVPPDFCLVPGRDDAIPDRIGSGLQTCPGGASYIVKRTTASPPGKDTRRLAEGIQRVQRPPDQPKTREGQGIYRLADGRWETLKGPGQSWWQDVPAITMVNIPRQRALFLCKKPLAQIESDADYEILADGVFDLGGLAWQPQAAIFVAAPYGVDGVLSLSHHGQVIPAARAVRSSDTRSVWVPPGFEMIREQRQWESGFHEHIAVSGYRVAQISHSTLRGDLPAFDSTATHIRTRRDAAPPDDLLTFTTQEKPLRQQKLEPVGVEGNEPNTVPAFQSVKTPEGSVLRLYQNRGFGGECLNITGSRDLLDDLPWTPHSFAFGEAPYGEDGIIYTKRGRRAAVVPQGYQVGKLDGKWFGPGYVYFGEPQGWWVLSPRQAEPEPIASGCAAGARIGILALKRGTTGLALMRQPTALRGAGDELRFGDQLLRPDRWYHLALTWDGKTMRQLLDGRQVQQTDSSEEEVSFSGPWVLGECFRGSIAQVRVWNVARTPEQIRDERYPSTQPATAPALDLFAQGVEAWQAPPAAVVVSADLPAAPADTVFVKHMQQQVEAENARSVQAAHQQATTQRILAHKRAQRLIALAHEKARRDIHIQGIKQLGFVRGSGAWFGSLESLTRRVDMISGVAVDLALGPGGISYQSAAEVTTLDFSGKHARASHEGKVWFGKYWITAAGAIGRGWIPPEQEWPDDQQVLFEFDPRSVQPVGRPNDWDIALDVDEQILYWTNGWELFWCDVKEDKPEHFQVLLPHVASPSPIAIAVAPDGSLLWLDAKDEVVRMLPGDKLQNAIGAQYAEAGVVPGDRIENVLGAAVVTLYPAPRPARGLAVSRLEDKNGSGKAAAYVYWVAAARRTIETPVLDTPGRYIDLYHDPRHPHWHGQHVEMVAVSEFAGVQWTDATDGSPTRALAFGAGQDSDPAAAGQSDQPASADDVLTFEPVRLDLRHGFTVSAVLVWQRTGFDPQTAICLYELATFEDEDRLVCLIGPDAADGQSGIPFLHLRWDGHVVTGEFQIVSNRRLRANEQQRVTWMLDRHGVVTTYIEGEKVVEAKISLPDGVRVFEGHALGAPNPAQTHEMITGALLQRDDPRQVFAAFQGRIVRFGAWNCTAPQAAQGWEQTPGPDPTWARSLVTVESTRRYLHAGRLDGQEPPVTLFPIELDGGLNIETALDQAHAELTLAHAQKAAAEEQAAHLKAVALQDAHARLAAATQNLSAAQTQAAADVSAAQGQADRDKAAARDRMRDADAQAERDRVQGKQDADQHKADNEATARDMETRAAADKRNRIADANRRRSDAQDRLDDAKS